MIHYRKAKKGDIKCKDCGYNKKPNWHQKRIRCSLNDYETAGNGYAIGENMTCDKAVKKII